LEGYLAAQIIHGELVQGGLRENSRCKEKSSCGTQGGVFKGGKGGKMNSVSRKKRKTKRGTRELG